MFITFEGADGSGKSTQLNFVRDYLTNYGYQVVVTRDPGGTELGLKLREILLSYKGNISSLTEMFIFLGDRAQNVEQIIKPALKSGKIVLCDRYIDSTAAYQGYARGISLCEINSLNKIATTNLIPDLTLLFDVLPEIGLARVDKNGPKDRLESEKLEFHQRVSQGYISLAREYPKRFVIIDANKTLDEVTLQVKSVIDKFLKS